MTVSTNRPKQRDLKNILVPVILVILGLAVLVYPVVATQWNNHRQQTIANEYAKLEKQADPNTLNQQLEDARAYNKNLTLGPILDPWLETVVKDNDQYRDYLNKLNQFDSMGRLIVPTAQVNLPIYHGTEHETLQKGVGHLFGSDLPVGGVDSHSVLTAHTGLPNATLFDNLKNVKEGDAIYIQVSGEKLKYEVDQIKVVLPNETDDLRPVQGKDYVTLVTCTPYGINSHRLLVRGHQVPMDESDHKAIEDAQGVQWQWWMWALLVGAILVAIALIWWLRRQLKNNKSESVSAKDLVAKYNLERGLHE